MTQLTKNIWQSELTCQCGSCSVSIQAHEPIVKLVQDACDYFARSTGVDKVTLKITSAARCQAHNKAIGSNDESQHIRCSAVDIQIFSQGRQIPPQKVYDYFDGRFPDSCGVGFYPADKGSFTHFDTRIPKKRW